MQEPTPFFRAICGGYDSNFCYLIGAPQSTELALIEAALPWTEIKPFWQEAKEAGYQKIGKILLTHAHHDHVIFLAELKAQTGATIYAHEAMQERIVKLTGLKPDIALKGGETIKLGDEKIKTIHTPGHQPDCISMIWRQKFFTGDTLFVEGCGRCNFSESSLEDQFNSLKFIAQELPDHLEIHPGHDYGSVPSSTIGREKQNNKYLKPLTKQNIHSGTQDAWIALRK